MSSVDHPVFGTLAVDPSGGIEWDGQQTLSGRSIDFDLTMALPPSGPGKLLDKVAPFFSQLSKFDMVARAYLQDDLAEDEDSPVGMYLDHHLEELGDKIVRQVFGKPVAEVDDAAFLAALMLCRVGLYPEEADACAVFDYSVSREHTQYILVVTFDHRGQVTNIEMES
jgi:hypothetical protein